MAILDGGHFTGAHAVAHGVARLLSGHCHNTPFLAHKRPGHRGKPTELGEGPRHDSVKIPSILPAFRPRVDHCDIGESQLNRSLGQKAGFLAVAVNQP